MIQGPQPAITKHIHVQCPDLFRLSEAAGGNGPPGLSCFASPKAVIRRHPIQDGVP